MSTAPKKYTKEEFIDFVTNTLKCNNDTIQKLNKIPETFVDENNDEYDITIIISSNDASYSYELNYYCKDDKKHLFPYIVKKGNVDDIIKDFYNKISQYIN